jgi:pimeloyl-ACP methyl ester carboxylesterase
VVIQGKPWAFDLDAIVAPVSVHHGEQDTMTPVAHARHTAGLIPGARLTIWPGEGHISLIGKIPEITADLVDLLR